MSDEQWPGTPVETWPGTPADSAPPDKEKSSGLMDFFKSIPRGALTGMSQALSASGQAAQAEMGQEADVPSPEQTRDILEKEVTGELHQPQTPAGQYGATMGEFLGSPASYVGPGGPLGKAITAGMAGLGSEAAGQWAKGTAWEPWARVAGAIAGGSPRAGIKRTEVGAAPSAVKPGTAAAEFNIPLTTGEAAGDLSKIQMEQAALRGGLGRGAQQEAEQFHAARREAINTALEDYAARLDAEGQQIASSPIAGAERVGEGLRGAADQAKQLYKQRYQEFRDLPGVLHAQAADGIANRIKNRLTFSDEPIIIDDKTTPVANKALGDIEKTIDRLIIPNRADPRAPPPPGSIVGINLQGIDQVRKRLRVFAKDAWNNPSDKRAMEGIIKAFDADIENSISDGLFSGSDKALDKLKDARRAFAQYQDMFARQRNDGGVGAVIEKIVARNEGTGATANEMANWLYGAAGTGGSGQSTRVAMRVRDILGPESPEWSAIRQGMFQRLTQAVEGKDVFGPQKISQRIYEFVNGQGRSTANVMFSPQERAEMVRLANALKETVPPPGAVNWSNTAYVNAGIARSMVRNGLYALADFVLPHGISRWVGAASLVPREWLAGRRSAEAVRRSIYGEPPTVRRSPTLGLGLPPTATAAEQGFARGGAVKPAVNRSYDVPFLSGPSKDGKVVYIDRRLPARLKIKRAGGKGYVMIDPALPLSVHERTEQQEMERLIKTGMSDSEAYRKAHDDAATPAERRWVEQHGLSWSHYEEVMDGYIKTTEHENPKRPPPNLYVKPYSAAQRMRLNVPSRADGGKVDTFADRFRPAMAKAMKEEVERRRDEKDAPSYLINVPGSKEVSDQPTSERDEQAGIYFKRRLADGGAAKMPKAEAQYMDKSDKPKQRCMICSMFRAPSTCTAVQGPVKPAGWCKLFERK